MHEPNQMDTLPYASSGIALPENCFMLTQWFLTGGSQQISGVVRSLTHPTTRKVWSLVFAAYLKSGGLKQRTITQGRRGGKNVN